MIQGWDLGSNRGLLYFRPRNAAGKTKILFLRIRPPRLILSFKWGKGENGGANQITYPVGSLLEFCVFTHWTNTTICIPSPQDQPQNTSFLRCITKRTNSTPKTNDINHTHYWQCLLATEWQLCIPKFATTLRIMQIITRKKWKDFQLTETHLTQVARGIPMLIGFVGVPNVGPHEAQ